MSFPCRQASFLILRDECCVADQVGEHYGGEMPSEFRHEQKGPTLGAPSS